MNCSDSVLSLHEALERLGATEAINGVGVFVTLRGPDVAAEERRVKTLLVLRRALAEALRAGHTYEDIQRLIKEEAWKRRSA